jgi:hypothetical protein
MIMRASACLSWTKCVFSMPSLLVAPRVALGPGLFASSARSSATILRFTPSLLKLALTSASTALVLLMYDVRCSSS